MPTAPMRLCSGKGGLCRNRVTHGRCADCTRATNRQRTTAHARGYTSAWTAYAAQFRRNYPVCGMRADGQRYPDHSACTQRGRVTTDDLAVDHIRPHTGPSDPGFFDPANLQVLCRTCHGAKTATYDAGFGHPLRGRP
jgi:5-methylcytosine-specific restriction protein A